MDSISYADPETINGLNLYAYCGNNPVMNIDPDGNIFFTCLIMGMVAGAVIGATLNGVNAYNNGARGWEIFGAAALGAVVGAAVGAAAGAIVGGGVIIGGAGISAIGSGAAAFAGGGSLASSGALVASGVGTLVAGGALSATGVLGGLLGLNVLFATTGKSGGYWGQKYSNDHAPDHIHLKGTDGTDIKIGRDGNPLPGQPALKPQQRKALNRLWEEFLALFG